MVIDIDLFLDRYGKDDKASPFKVEQKFDLDFQKDIETKLYNIEEKSKNSDFEVLKKIYDEVKNFDLDLSNKFLGIEQKGDQTLKNIGDKYSVDFLENLKKYALSLDNLIGSDLMDLDKELKNKNYTKIIFILKNIITNYNLYPKEFLSKRITINNQIKDFEIKLYEDIKKFKTNELKDIKLKLKEEIIKLNSLLKPNNFKEIETQIEKLKYYVNSIPRLFISDLLDEKIYVLKVISKSEKYLEQDYKKEFEYSKKVIYDLFDKFHKYSLSMNVDKVVLTYDEILLEFNNLPDVFIEEKIKIYMQINSLYSSINNLMLKNNISMFMLNYNSSQVLKEVKDYLRHSHDTNHIEYHTLLLLKEKLSKLPKKFDLEKRDLETQINQYLSFIDKKVNDNDNVSKNIEKKIIKENLDVDKLVLQKKIEHPKFMNFEDEKFIFKKISSDFQNLKNIKDFQIFFKRSKDFLNDLEKETRIKQNFKDKIKEDLIKILYERKKLSRFSSNTNSDNIENNVLEDLNPVFENNKKDHNAYYQNEILKKINLNYEKLKTSNNSVELKQYYKQINLYLNVLNISSEKKVQIITKVKNTLMEKKIN